MWLLGDLDMLPFVRAIALKWIGHVNRMDSTKEVIQIFNDKLQERRQRGRQK